MLDFENHVQEIKTRLISIKDTQKLPVKTFSKVIDTVNIKLPELYIPFFDGKPNEWLTFKQTFESVIHNNPNIKSSITKFNFLLKYLQGDARAAIGHIDLSHNGYIKAWDELNNRFHNTKVLVDVHIHSLLNLPQIVKGTRNSQELKDILNQAIGHTSSLEACSKKIDNLGELFIINCVVRKLNNYLRKEWETEFSANVLPTWVQLKKFLIEKSRVIDLIEPSTSTKTHNPIQSFKKNLQKPNILPNFKSQSNPSYKSSVFVTSNSNPQPYDSNNHQTNRIHNFSSPNKCVFCNLPFHRFIECSKFMGMSTQERYEKVKQFNLCLNCFCSKHFTSKCTSHGCKLCSNKHNTLIHHNNTSNSRIISNPNFNQNHTSSSYPKSTSEIKANES